LRRVFAACCDVTMDARALLIELYGRIPPRVGHVVTGLADDELLYRPTPAANSIAWLVWHLARVEDLHVAEILDTEQIWVTTGWAARFGLAPDPANHGYGHDADQVSTVRPDSGAALTGYFDDVHARTDALLAGLTDEQLDRIVDRAWDPPVTLGVRLISVADDCLEHVGQAAYVRGLLDR
jgi:uncharacterized protein DUF664